MKKIIITAMAVLFAAATMSAQDLEQATNTFNNGVMSLQMGDNATALASFQQALSMAEACGDAGADIVANCKNTIPAVLLAIGKDYIKAKDYDKAITQIKDACKVAEEYGAADVVEEGTALIPQILTQKANDLLRNKNFAAAIPAFQEAIAANPDNGKLYLQLGSTYAAAGNLTEAEAAYNKAAELGEKTTASKQLANMYLRSANASYKAKKYAEAISNAEKCLSYAQNANAYLIIGNSARQLNDNAKAIEYYEKYVAAPGAKNVNGYIFTIAALYQQAGNKAKAIEFYQKVATDPQYGSQAEAQLKALQQ